MALSILGLDIALGRAGQITYEQKPMERYEQAKQRTFKKERQMGRERKTVQPFA